MTGTILQQSPHPPRNSRHDARFTDPRGRHGPDAQARIDLRHHRFRRSAATRGRTCRGGGGALGARLDAVGFEGAARLGFAALGARVGGVALLEETLAFKGRDGLIVRGEVGGCGAVGAGAFVFEVLLL